MPHWIATSWDKYQILILTAKTKKGKAFYEKAVRILPDMPAGKSTAQTDVVPEFTPEMVKAKLRHFVQQERLGKYDTVVVMGRDDVEVRPMVFPPVPNDEIPDLAKFQASKEFTEYDQTASLDYVLFDGAKKDKRHILAASLTKSRRDVVEDVIAGAGLDLQRIVLGPCESAKRFATLTVQQRTGGAGKTTLLVEMDELSATLVLLYRGQPAFVRTAHFQKSVWTELEQVNKKQFENADELSQWKWLTSEFKRTIVAAINDVPSEKIDEIVLCGVGERYEKLMVLLEESIAVPVSLFNVWRFENRDGEIKNHLPVFEEQFLPLIGALTATLAEKPNALDFKNPKRKPEKHTNRNLVTAIVAVCVLLVIATGGWGFLRRMAIEEEWKQVQNEKNELVKATARHDQLEAQIKEITKWKQNGEVNWLEQLEWLSNNMLRSQDVIVTGSLSLSAPVNNTTSTIRFYANTRGQAIVPQLENSLRDDTHKVLSPKLTPSQDRTYTHTADITVQIVPPPKKTPPPPATAKLADVAQPEKTDEAGETSATGGTTENVVSTATPGVTNEAVPNGNGMRRMDAGRQRSRQQGAPPPGPNDSGVTNETGGMTETGEPTDGPAPTVTPDIPDTAVPTVEPTEPATDNAKANGGAS